MRCSKSHCASRHRGLAIEVRYRRHVDTPFWCCARRDSVTIRIRGRSAIASHQTFISADFGARRCGAGAPRVSMSMMSDVTIVPDPSAQSTLDGAAIRQYDELKLKIAAIGQAAMQRCKEIKDEEGARQFQPMLAHLAEDRFNLAVLGQFSRG